MEIVDRSKGRPHWSEATVVRYVLGGLAFGSVVGLIFALGGTFAPWVGLLAGVVFFGSPAWVLFSRHMHARADERDRQVPEPANYGGDVPEM
jgi:hypothetical protein